MDSVLNKVSIYLSTYSRLVADKLFVLDVWVSLSSTGLYFGSLSLLGHRVIFKAANTHCIFSLFFSLLEYAKESKLLLWHESQAIAVTNSNTYSDPLIQWVSVKRSLRCVNNIYFSHKTGGRKENKSCFLFFNNCR